MILDVDGTLVDSNDAHARAWVEAFAGHGITVAFDHVRRCIGMGGDKLMPEVARTTVAPRSLAVRARSAAPGRAAMSSRSVANSACHPSSRSSSY